MNIFNRSVFFLVLSVQFFYLNGDVLIHAGNLIDVETGNIESRKSIVIKNSLITSISDGYINRSDFQEYYDLKDSYVLPGLMDAHVHLAQEYVPKAERDLKVEPEFNAIFAAANAIKTLNAGFTTVRNVGDGGMETISLRNAINKGIVPGPRILTSGKTIATTGGHGDPTNGLPTDLYEPPTPEEGVVDSFEDIKKAVRQRYKDGTDGIKITATGGVLSVAKSGENPQFTNSELEALISIANDYGLWVAAHAHGKEGMLRAVDAGVTSIEHGTFMDSEVMEAMKKNGTYYVPTILAGEWVAKKSKIDNFFPELVRPKAAKIGPQILDTFTKAHKYGVKIAFGTDSGVSAHGDNWQEFVLMVKGGMSPLETIQSATLETAKLFKLENEIGKIKTGFSADIIALKNNPLENIESLKDISFVMKEGTRYK
ncbi:MAG: amidohydrolase family protein [SAR86 cluster bacterium]|uniref:Amidohydrolase family protein n=1 Tax=SAR86 cluster bacterium TaxID=2030880 RepID=A0A368BUW3_9GAMM|nr:MAG: amidohydrolase family protein [SAR86 cluster bacterium]